MLYLIHPVAVMWTGKVQCRICATSVVLCRATSGVKCCDAMWNGVVHGECGGVLMQDVKCGCGIPSDAEWLTPN